jgi:hypothetical protein
MKQLIYNNYTIILILTFVIALISIYIINNYNTGFFGGFVAGMCSAVSYQ